MCEVCDKHFADMEPDDVPIKKATEETLEKFGLGSEDVKESGYDQLWNYFGSSYASWLTIPRILMHAMPDEWQEKMAKLLEEYQDTFPNQPDVGTRVHITDLKGKLIKCPKWLLNYRRPNQACINELRKDSNGE